MNLSSTPSHNSPSSEFTEQIDASVKTGFAIPVEQLQYKHTAQFVHHLMNAVGGRIESPSFLHPELRYEAYAPCLSSKEMCQVLQEHNAAPQLVQQVHERLGLAWPAATARVNSQVLEKVIAQLGTFEQRDPDTALLLRVPGMQDVARAILQADQDAKGEMLWGDFRRELGINFFGQSTTGEILSVSDETRASLVSCFTEFRLEVGRKLTACFGDLSDLSPQQLQTIQAVIQKSSLRPDIYSWGLKEAASIDPVASKNTFRAAHRKFGFRTPANEEPFPGLSALSLGELSQVDPTLHKHVTRDLTRAGEIVDSITTKEGACNYGHIRMTYQGGEAVLKNWDLSQVGLANITTSGPSHLVQSVINGLSKVYDPEMPLNMLDLGLIYAVRVQPDGRALEVDYTLTDEHCSQGPKFEQDMLEKIQAEMSADCPTCSLNRVSEPQWTPHRMSQAGKEWLMSQS